MLETEKKFLFEGNLTFNQEGFLSVFISPQRIYKSSLFIYKNIREISIYGIKMFLRLRKSERY